jgi:hypothetical protein
MKNLEDSNGGKNFKRFGMLSNEVIMRTKDQIGEL